MSDESLSENEILNDETASLVYAFAAAPGLIPGQSGLAFAACSTGILRSDDGGQTWQDALADLNLSEPLPVTSLAISPRFDRGGKVFGGAPGGIFHSTGGQSFKAVLFPTPLPTISSLGISPNFEQDETVFAGTMEDGVFVSKNAGEQWVAWNFGLLDLNVMCLAISPAFASDETLFAGTETGIFRSTSGGRAWRELEPSFGYEAVLSLALSHSYAQDHTLYAGTESQGLWRSNDEGETWSRLGAGVIDDPVNSLLVADDGSLLALTSERLWRSTDGGATWQAALNEESGEREFTAVLVPQGATPGALALVGYTDGKIDTVKFE